MSKAAYFALSAVLWPALLCGCGNSARPSASLEVAVRGVHGASLSDDGRYLVIGSINHGGSFWDIENRQRIFNWNHQENKVTTIVSADISGQGKWALTANPFHLVLWDTQSGRGERFWSAPGEILDAELGPNASMAILGLSDHSAVIFNIRRGGILRTFNHNGRVRSVDLSGNGKLALTGSEDYSASLWDVTSGKKLTSLKHEDDVQLVKLSSDGTLALSVSKYDRALIWQTNSGDVIGEVPLRKERIKRGITFTCAKFSDDNALLLTGRPDQLVELWEVATLNNLARWKLPKRDAWKPTSAAVVDVSFGKDRQNFLAIASNGFVHLLKN